MLNDGIVVVVVFVVFNIEPFSFSHFVYKMVIILKGEGYLPNLSWILIL